MNIQVKFGQKLKELRLEKRLTQEKLAHLAEIDRTYLPGIEKGERNVSLSVIDKLSKALNIEVKDFFI
ncbi:MAG: transcriptional regulator with XRE-family HTH domain [Parvicella sp.]|jgi:transcriptional regulator with XRE-family HTH domain